MNKRRFYAFGLFLIWSFILIGCGKKTKPYPQGVSQVFFAETLKKISDVKAFYRTEQKLVLSWSVEKEINDELERFIISKRKIDPSCFDCFDVEKLIEINPDRSEKRLFQKAELNERMTYFQVYLDDPTTDQFTEYFVQYKNQSQRISPISNAARAVKHTLPPTPKLELVEHQEKGFLVRWASDERRENDQILFFADGMINPFQSISANKGSILINKRNITLYARFQDQFLNETQASNRLILK